MGALYTCCRGWTTMPSTTELEDFFADYLENRELLFATEAQLRQAYDDIAHVVAEKLLAPVGPPTAARASSSDARLAAGPAA